ncbi:SAYSvFN domain-containing protein 1 [Sorochytrium milnesiophthora]
MPQHRKQPTATRLPLLPHPLDDPRFLVAFLVLLALFAYAQFAAVYLIICALALVYLNTATPPAKDAERPERRYVGADGKRLKGKARQRAKAAGDTVTTPEAPLSAYSVFNKNMQKLDGEFDVKAWESRLRQGGVA